jgi:hypothetical protein
LNEIVLCHGLSYPIRFLEIFGERSNKGTDTAASKQEFITWSKDREASRVSGAQEGVRLIPNFINPKDFQIKLKSVDLIRSAVLSDRLQSPI